MPYVADSYDAQPENEWQRLQRHRTEFAVTLRALEAYLPPPPASIPPVPRRATPIFTLPILIRFGR